MPWSSQSGQHLPLLLAVEQVVVVLHGDEAGPAVQVGDVLGLGELPGVHRGGAEVAGLAGPDHVVQRLHRLLDRRVVVPAVDLVEVDVVDAEPGQRGVDLAHDRDPGQPGPVGPGSHPAVHLGRDDHLVARRHLLQQPTGDLLAGAAGVDVGGVEDGDPRLQRGPHDRAGGVLVHHPRVAAASGVAPALACRAWTSREHRASSPVGRRASARPRPPARRQGARSSSPTSRRTKGEALAKELGGVFVHADVTNTEQVIAAVEAAKELGPLAVLVNCAGIGWRHPHHRPGRQLRARPTTSTPSPRSSQINLIGTFNCIRLAATAMSQNEPRRRRRAGRHRQHRLGRGLRRPDRPGRLLGLEGRRGRHDAADRPRPRRRRHPGQHHRPRPDRHADLRRGRGLRGVQGQARARRAVPEPPRAAPTSSPAWPSSCSPTAT